MARRFFIMYEIQKKNLLYSRKSYVQLELPLCSSMFLVNRKHDLKFSFLMQIMNTRPCSAKKILLLEVCGDLTSKYFLKSFSVILFYSVSTVVERPQL